jgi:hypothetical protein
VAVGKALSGLAVLSAGVGYLGLVRPWQLQWGASTEEVARAMPGDDLVDRPTFNATRAVTVAAGPEHIWPWLLQIGINRAGWYSYDWLDNLGRPSATSIIPDLQELEIGDLIPMSPNGQHGLRVWSFMPEQWMVWVDDQGNTSWLWMLDPVDENTTRLITRVRMRYQWLRPEIILDLLVEFGDLVMMRKCMLGIKERAEGLAHHPLQSP